MELTLHAKIFSRVVFPAPDAPIIAVTVPALKMPETPLRICFSFEVLRKGIAELF